MNGRDHIIEYVKKYVNLTDAEALLFSSYFKETKVIKGQFVIQPGFTAQHRNYVCLGALRGFVIDAKGKDHTITIAIENWWISDVGSYIYQRPATMFVVALENSLIMQLEYQKEQELKKANPKFESFFRMNAERALAFMQRRAIINLTHTAEERYDYFLEKYPSVALRVPQYALASYLNMTTQFLSRIRKRKTQNQAGDF